MSERPIPSRDLPGMAAAGVTIVLWGSAFVGIRAVAPDLSPGSLALARLAIGALALGILVALRPWPRPSRRDAGLIAASGLIWFAAYNVVLNEAERNVDAGTASMLVNMGPIFIAILAGLFLHEGIHPRLLAGCAIAFAGTATIALANSTAPVAGGNALLGTILCVVAALSYSAGTLLQKPALARVPALHVTWLATVVGAAACLPFAPTLLRELAAAPTSTLAWAAYLGLFPTAIAFTTWAYALRRTSAGRLGVTTYLVPPVAVVLGWAMLAEVPAPLALVGGVLCVVGVLVARSSRAPWRSLVRRVRTSPAADVERSIP